MCVLALVFSLAAQAKPAPSPVEQYGELRELARFRGRGVDGLVFAPKAQDTKDAALRARFPEAFALLAQNPARPEVLREFIVIGSPDSRSYEAEHALVDEGAVQTVTLKVVFDGAWNLTNLIARVRDPPPVSPHRDAPPLVLRFPIEDRPLLVSAAGDTAMENHHITNPDQRWAIDLLGYRNGGTHGTNPGKKNPDYAIWGAPVRAPIDGVIAASANDVADHTRPNVEWQDPAHPFGNHVVIQAGPREYVVLGHLQKGTVLVQPGDLVKAGNVLGRVGNSGNCTEPHLHIHVQDGPLLKQGDAIPFVFRALKRNGERKENQAPVRGDLVEGAR